jgi:transketolase
LLGFVLAKDPHFWAAVRRALPAAVLSAILLGTGLSILWAHWEALSVSGDWNGIIWPVRMARLAYAWVAIVTLLALAQRFLNRPSRALTYLTEAIFPWYILHQTLTVMLGFWLTRQNLPAVRTDHSEENLCRFGAYDLAPASDDEVVTLFATGSEVEIALAAQRLLEAKGHPARVVSVPSMERFAMQSAEYHAAIVGSAAVKVAIEAGVRQSWDRLIGSDGIFIGMDGFGASAPYEQLYRHFGITAEAVVEAVEARLAGRN